MAANENVYEAMFIFDANRFARDRAALPSEVEQMIKSAGGEVLVSRLWEERRLAYPINGHRKGTYWLMYFRGNGSILTDLNRQWEVHDNILRQLVLKVHPHLVEVVLEHAQADPSKAAPEPAKAAPSRPRRPPSRWRSAPKRSPRNPRRPRKRKSSEVGRGWLARRRVVHVARWPRVGLGAVSPWRLTHRHLTYFPARSYVTATVPFSGPLASRVDPPAA